MANVTVVLDGTETSFELDENGETILNTALDKGVDAPYSCKGGVCTTCMAKLLEGTVHMDANYALTDGELKKGFILVCQSHPTSEKVKITWDI
ncbi:MAG: 2Fe-2S iron-sulfur cluster binding domain-containing protein [Crocinitomicaceae bacterium]|nr:2Fe-2S iron-sulfur cluster binding domain-containing protein [Crocinitomicaceae bacterium]